MLIKVHRVCSLEEAEQFETLGADLIGVSMAADDHFADERTVGVDVAVKLARQLTAQLVLEPPRESTGGELVALARKVGARWVQTPFFATPDSPVRAALADAGIGLLVSRLDADYDMDPSWVLGPAEDLGAPSPDLIEVEIIPSFTDSWRFLTKESPQYADELQIADLEGLARTAPLFLSVDFTPGNVSAVRAAIPSARGLSFTLGTLAAGVSRLHVLAPDAVTRLLEAVMESNP